MTNNSDIEHPGNPIAWSRRVLRGAWNDLLSVYYANTVVWRLLKSAALVAMGLFLWSGANLLLSYRADWGFLYYVMAYGFVLLFWGPFTHLLVVPAVIRLRRSGTRTVERWLSRHGSKLNLSVFLIIVLILGTMPLGIMTFEFQFSAGGGGDSINPQLACTKSDGTIHCHLSNTGGVETVVVKSGGETLQTLESAPFEFNIQESDLATVQGDRQFTVEVQDADGAVVRRYIRRAELIPG